MNCGATFAIPFDDVVANWVSAGFRSNTALWAPIPESGAAVLLGLGLAPQLVAELAEYPNSLDKFITCSFFCGRAKGPRRASSGDLARSSSEPQI